MCSRKHVAAIDLCCFVNLPCTTEGKYGSSFKSAKFHVGADHKKAVELLVKQVVADAAQVAEEADDNFTIGMVLDTFLDCAKNLLDPETDAGKASVDLIRKSDASISHSGVVTLRPRRGATRSKLDNR